MALLLIPLMMLGHAVLDIEDAVFRKVVFAYEVRDGFHTPLEVQYRVKQEIFGSDISATIRVWVEGHSAALFKVQSMYTATNVQHARILQALCLSPDVILPVSQRVGLCPLDAPLSSQNAILQGLGVGIFCISFIAWMIVQVMALLATHKTNPEVVQASRS